VNKRGCTEEAEIFMHGLMLLIKKDGKKIKGYSKTIVSGQPFQKRRMSGLYFILRSYRV
jgi:hypothetical protein